MPLADLDPRRANRFNAFLDGLVDGKTASASELDPALVKTANALHTYASITAPVPTQAHGWARVRAWAPALSPSPARTVPPRRVETRRGRLTAELATGLLVVLTVLGGAFAMSHGPTWQQVEDEPAVAIYAIGDNQTRIQLDPLTLEDLSAPETTLVATPESWATPVSNEPLRSGSVWYPCSGQPGLLRVDWEDATPEDTWPDDEPWAYVVRDGYTGTEISRFGGLTAAQPLGVSRDCGRLVLSVNQYPPATWHVVDTKSGQLVATSRSAGVDVGLGWHGLLNPDATRVYRLVYDDAVGQTDPGTREDGVFPTRIVELDLDTGETRTVEELPTVLGGNWQNAVHGGYMFFTPNVAVSPDGT